MQKPISLLGLPGSGKSYWGAQLSKQLDYSFIDLDDAICKETNSTISNIFEQGGEQLFRNIETQVLFDIFTISSEKAFIISLGGGTPAFNNNMELINQYTNSIYLNISTKTIVHNLLNDLVNHRPLVKKSTITELEQYIDNLRIERNPFYKLADYMLFDHELKIQNFEKIIKDICIRNQ